MKPRWQLNKNRIAQILETYGLEVRLWDVEDGVFLGAIVDGYKPDWIAQQSDSPDANKMCSKCDSDWAKLEPTCPLCGYIAQVI